MMAEGRRRSGLYREFEAPTPKRKRVSFCRLISYRDTLDLLLMIVGTIGAIGAGTSQPLLALLFGDAIDAFNPKDLSEMTRSNMLHEVSVICVKLVYTAIGCGAASVLGNNLGADLIFNNAVVGWSITAERQAGRIRSLYLKSLLRQDVSYFDEEFAVGEAMNTISGALLIQDALGDKVANVIELTTRFVAGFVIGLYSNWKMTAVTLAALPPTLLIGGAIALGLTKATNQATIAYSEAGEIVNEVLGSIRTVASNTGEERAIKDYDEALEKAETAGISVGYASGVGIGVVMFVSFSTYALAMWYGTQIVADGEATAGEIINTIFAVVMGGSALAQAAPHAAAVLTGLSAAYNIIEVIERKPKIDSNDLSGRILPEVRGNIHLSKINFAYPTRPDSPIFKGFDLFIQAGTTAALVGESGSGKSSVIQLIERFYDPQSGQVLLDGVDIRELQLRWLRNQISLVSQEPVLFATTVANNVKYGKDDATQEEIEAACVIADAALFIDRLPQGFDTQVGDRGIQLSGGQKQRVAIARALLKNPRILLLDEATSALDRESEHVVQSALDRVMTGRTTLVVAHRLSTIQNADLIAVVQKGVVIETGVHEDLIQKVDSAYNRLIRLQESQHVDEVILEDGEENNEDNVSVKSGKLEEGSFRKPSRDRSSRRLSRHVQRGSSSGLSIVSDLFSVTSSEHPSPALLDNDSDLEPEDRSKENLDDDQKVPFSRLARMNKPELPFFIIGSIGSAAYGAVLPLYAFIFGKAIAAMTKESPEEVKDEGRLFALLFVALGGWALLSGPCEKISFSYVGNRLLRRLRLRSFEKIVRQDIAWFDEDRHSSAKLGSRLLADAAAVRSVIGETLSVMVEAISAFVVGFAFAFSASWQLTLIVLALSPFLSAHALIQLRTTYGLEPTIKDNLDQASQVASDAMSNIRTVASFCSEEKMVQLYSNKSKGAINAGVEQGIKNGLGLGMANFSLFCAYALSFYTGAKLVDQGKLEGSQVFLVFLSIALASLQIAQAFRMGPDMGRSRPAMRSIFGLLDQVSKMDPIDEKGLSLPDLKGHIRFKHVSFKYPTRPTVRILQSLSFTLKAGKSLAVVGESGSGKSTVISLIERFYDPNSGTILLDGVDIQLINLRWLRQNIGLVSQEPVLFDDTIKENILYGKDGMITEDEIHEAARCANAHTFISGLPDGYNTRVGERGIQLSGGQKQRVAIARAIVKYPKILLLDEATSALDLESERVVQEALDRIMVRRSTIIVAHRFSTVRNCDKILVLKDGFKAEKGTYDDLIATGGIFASLVREKFNNAPAVSE